MRRVQQQSNPSLSKSNQKLNCAWDRLVLCGLVALIFTIFYVNVQLLRASTSNGGVRETVKAAVSAGTTSDLPALLLVPYPKRTAKAPIPLTAWDKWAAAPMVGSYKFSPDSVIHFPYAELQSHYHDLNPPFVANGYASPTVTKGLVSPDPDLFLLTRKGNKFSASGVRANQDRATMISWHNGDWWMGLFDGHGTFGHAVSQYSAFEFIKRLTNCYNEDAIANIPEFLKQTCVSVHQNMPKLQEAGTTAISIWKRKNQLHISNVGDSFAFVCSFDRQGNVNIVVETKPHKPDDPEERKRIQSMGGQVQDPPMPGLSARVLIPVNGGLDILGLAMSRSLGDHEGGAYGVIPEPTTISLNLDKLNPNLEYLVVLASDGLFDKVPHIEVARHVASTFLPGSTLLPLEAAEQLILKSSQSWKVDPMGSGYRDDITLTVRRLRI